MDTPERESIEFDVVIVGAGPSSSTLVDIIAS